MLNFRLFLSCTTILSVLFYPRWLFTLSTSHTRFMAAFDPNFCAGNRDDDKLCACRVYKEKEDREPDDPELCKNCGHMSTAHPLDTIPGGGRPSSVPTTFSKAMGSLISKAMTQSGTSAPKATEQEARKETSKGFRSKKSVRFISKKCIADELIHAKQFPQASAQLKQSNHDQEEKSKKEDFIQCCTRLSPHDWHQCTSHEFAYYTCTHVLFRSKHS